MNKDVSIAVIKYYENEETRRLIGRIDVDMLKYDRIECLFYVFPLIERMAVEIFKLVPNAEVEHLSQGVMRTIISVIDCNNSTDILPSNIIEKIKFYYGTEGVRNKLFHVTSKPIDITVCFDELIWIISKLLVILRKKLNEYREFDFIPIKEL